MMRKFFMLVASIVGAFILVAGIAILAMQKSSEAKDRLAFENNDNPSSTEGASSMSVSTPDPEPEPTPEPTVDSLLLPPEKTNFLIVGEDAGEMLTDVILVGSFDRETKKISILSVPRDTYTVIPQARLDRMRELGLYPPYDGVMKMNAVHSYGGKKYGMILLQQQLEDMMGIDINYYIEVNLQAFRDIVDIVGGVDMEIRKGGYYYTDPYQNLVIAVPEGMVHLDGATAEGVVRYRADYRDGDIDRIDVQHTFLKLMFEQVLDKEHILRNAFGVASSVISYAKTNFGIGDIPKYVQYVDDLDPRSIEFTTLPGSPTYIDNISYYFADKAKVMAYANENFIAKGATAHTSNPGLNEESTQKPSAAPKTLAPAYFASSSKDAAIQVLNGAQVTGVAAKYKDILTTDGYQVADVGNYTGSYRAYTRILVKKEGLGEDLKGYFKDPIISVEPGMPERFDIIVIIGKDEVA
jgi:LCP family protein required for cell wall assembly